MQINAEGQSFTAVALARQRLHLNVPERQTGMKSTKEFNILMLVAIVLIEQNYSGLPDMAYNRRK